MRNSLLVPWKGDSLSNSSAPSRPDRVGRRRITPGSPSSSRLVRPRCCSTTSARNLCSRGLDAAMAPNAARQRLTALRRTIVTARYRRGPGVGSQCGGAASIPHPLSDGRPVPAVSVAAGSSPGRIRGYGDRQGGPRGLRFGSRAGLTDIRDTPVRSQSRCAVAAVLRSPASAGRCIGQSVDSLTCVLQSFEGRAGHPHPQLPCVVDHSAGHVHQVKAYGFHAAGDPGPA